jgi:hypothetical protein
MRILSILVFFLFLNFILATEEKIQTKEKLSRDKLRAQDVGVASAGYSSTVSSESTSQFSTNYYGSSTYSSRESLPKDSKTTGKSRLLTGKYEQNRETVIISTGEAAVYTSAATTNNKK